MLAARYHPDNPQTGDVEKFITLRKLSRFSRIRKRGNGTIPSMHPDTPSPCHFRDEGVCGGIEGETNRRMGILCLLYRTRRANPESPGMSILQLESIMSFPRDT